jgi:hypothetical protein
MAVVAADAGRRKDWADRMHLAISQCHNPLLKMLFGPSKARREALSDLCRTGLTCKQLNIIDIWRGFPRDYGTEGYGRVFPFKVFSLNLVKSLKICDLHKLSALSTGRLPS